MVAVLTRNVKERRTLDHCARETALEHLAAAVSAASAHSQLLLCVSPLTARLLFWKLLRQHDHTRVALQYLLKAWPEVQFRDAHQQIDGQKVERPSDRLSSSGCRGGQGSVAGRQVAEEPLN